MQVSKWGNSLAVRLPAGLVQALDLKEGEEVDLHLVGARAFEVVKKPPVKELLARLHQFRGRLPADFHFDRLEANESDIGLPAQTDDAMARSGCAAACR